MKKTLLLVGIGIIGLIGVALYLNPFSRSTVEAETPEVSIISSEDYPDISIQHTTYQDKDFKQPLLDALEVGVLVNEDFDTLKEDYDSIDFAITHRSQETISILAITEEGSIPFTYSLVNNSRVGLEDIFIDGATYFNILHFPDYPLDPLYPGFVIEEPNIIAFTTDGEPRPHRFDVISPFLSIDTLSDIHPELAGSEFVRREKEMAAQVLRARIETEINSIEDNVNCNIEKCVALTFDDGPGFETERLLDMLQKRNAPATFYILGQQAKKFPDVVKRIAKEGHSIGNHTLTHPNLQEITEEEVFKEITEAQNILYELTGKYPIHYRPPYGATRDLDTHYPFDEILWSIDTSDWKHRNTNETIRLATSNLEPGAIILMHDIHASTVDAVPAIIDSVRDQGYTLVTYEDLMFNEGSVYEPANRLIRSQNSIEP